MSVQGASATSADAAAALVAGDVGTWWWDLSSGAAEYSAAFAAMLGYAPGELAPTVETWRRLVHAEDCDVASMALAAHVGGRARRFEALHRLRRQDGSFAWCRIRGRALDDASPPRIGGVLLDASEETRARGRLREVEGMHEGIVQSVPAGVMTLDAAGGLRHHNDHLRRELGDCWHDFAVASVFDTPAARASPELSDSLRGLLRGRPFRDLDVAFQGCDGERRVMRFSGAPTFAPRNGAPHEACPADPPGDAPPRVSGALLLAQHVTAQAEAETQVRSMRVARPLVRAIVRDLITHANVDRQALAAVGRGLAEKAEARGVDEMVQAYVDMGLGSLRLCATDEDRFTFRGRDLMEREPHARLTTCFMTLGFLNGAVARAYPGTTTLGSEVSCESRGDPECLFVVRMRRAPLTPR